MEQYFLLLENKETGETAFYNDKTMLLSSFNSNFENITKPKTTIDCAKNLKDLIDQTIFILNRYYFISKAIIVDKYENTIFEIERDNLRTFLSFYKGKTA